MNDNLFDSLLFELLAASTHHVALRGEQINECIMKQNFDNDKGENRVNRQNKTGKSTSNVFLGRRPKTTNSVWSGERCRGFDVGLGGGVRAQRV